MREFEATQLRDYLEQCEQPPLLLDVRQPWEYDICHLENAQLVPMSEIPARMDEFDKEQEIVLICHHGIRSRQVGYYMEAMGFSNIINLSTGVAGWAQEVDRTMATY